MINPDILDYNNVQSETDQRICNLLCELIDNELQDSENKVWHAHPVWFLEGNPIVGYSKQKKASVSCFGAGNLLMKKN